MSYSGYLPPDFRLNNDRYTILEVLGQGGFGITYKAKDNKNNEIVAIKELFIKGHCVRDSNESRVQLQTLEVIGRFEDFKKRFEREAKQLGRISHQNIVKILDYFQGNNTSYIVMEFIDGKNLYEITKSSDTNLTIEECIDVISQVGQALEYLHNRNMYHRDIKPSNIMLTADLKRAILIDFGNAKEYIHSQSANLNNSRILTPGYAALEQYGELDAIGPDSEVYSLGASAYFIMTSKVPLDAASRAGNDRLKAPAKLNDSISSRLNKVILKAMAIRRANRYKSVLDFISEIHETLKTTEILTDEDLPHYFTTDEFTLEEILKDSADDDTETRLVRLGNDVRKRLYVLRVLVNNYRQDKFQELYEVEKSYFKRIGIFTSPLGYYNLGLGYYRPFLNGVTLKEFWEENRHRFVKRRKLTKEGEKFVITIFKKVIELDKWNLHHEDLRVDNILIVERFKNYEVYFVDFPLVKMFGHDRRVDDIFYELIGAPYESFLVKLSKHKRRKR